MLPLEDIRRQFPILSTLVHGRPLIYLDNAATTQKPLCVLDESRRYYERANANIHRGAHYLSQLATEAHEKARETAAQFLGAPSSRGIVFTSGCTMGINMVAQILAQSGRFSDGGDVVISADSHHSNIVPWQVLCERTGMRLLVVPLREDLSFDWEAYENILSPQTRIVAMPWISNALGLVNPIREIIAAARAANPGVLTLVDGAQSTASIPVDVAELECDFYAFSGHKIYAPTGIGVLWGREELLEELPPWLTGGEMISEVTFEKTTYNTLPFKYEAGTPNIEGAVSLAAALRFAESIGMSAMGDHEKALTDQLFDGLAAMNGIDILGGRDNRGPLVSITVRGVHAYDLGTLLDQMGIAVRTGHHCCQPLMQSLGIAGTTRFSFAVYNTAEEVNATLRAVERALAMLR